MVSSGVIWVPSTHCNANLFQIISLTNSTVLKECSQMAEHTGAHARWSRHKFGYVSQHTVSKSPLVSPLWKSQHGGHNHEDTSNIYFSISALDKKHSMKRPQKWAAMAFSPSADFSSFPTCKDKTCFILTPALFLSLSPYFFFPLNPPILTSTQFPSTSWKRTQNGSDLEATSRSSRLVAVTDSSTRVTQCWGATLRVWPSVAEPRV